MVQYSTPLHLYERAIELHKTRGWGSRKIEKELDGAVNRRTIVSWIREGRGPVIIGVFNETPSPELSYLLGVRYSDATVTDNVFKLEACDKDFVEEFNRCLSKVMGRPYKISKDKKGWRTEIAVQSIVDFMQRPLDTHKSIIKAYPVEFLKGFFDGEGHVGEYKRGKYVYGYIGAKNTNFEVIQYVGKLLDRFSIHYNLYKVKECKRNCKPYLILFINREESVKRFHELIGFSIGRKAQKLEKLIQERGRKGGLR
jgi:intein-encoded DNA endonuclease-like protein